MLTSLPPAFFFFQNIVPPNGHRQGDQGKHVSQGRGIGEADQVVGQPEGRAQKGDHADAPLLFEPQGQGLKDDPQNGQKAERVLIHDKAKAKEAVMQSDNGMPLPFFFGFQIHKMSNGGRNIQERQTLNSFAGSELLTVKEERNRHILGKCTAV